MDAVVDAFRTPDVGTRRRHLLDIAFQVLALAVLLLALAALGVLLYDVFSDGIGRLDWQFLTSFSSRRAATAGIYHALAGSIFVIALTGALALPEVGAFARPENAASIRVLEKAGFRLLRFEARLERNHYTIARVGAAAAGGVSPRR